MILIILVILREAEAEAEEVGGATGWGAAVTMMPLAPPSQTAARWLLSGSAEISAVGEGERGAAVAMAVCTVSVGGAAAAFS